MKFWKIIRIINIFIFIFLLLYIGCKLYIFTNMEYSSGHDLHFKRLVLENKLTEMVVATLILLINIIVFVPVNAYISKRNRGKINEKQR